MHAITDQPASSSKVICCDPIFLLGIMPRSGTNFLYNLLNLHPDCKGVNERDIPEDRLLSNATLLIRYVNNVASFWCNHGRRGKGDAVRENRNAELQKQLLTSIGTGLLDYLEHLNPDRLRKPLLTKTPLVDNLDAFFHLFPEARLIILVRDGRSVVESNVQSFVGTRYEVAMRRWARAAKTIDRFNKAYKNTQERYLIVKYEELLENLPAELERIFDFLAVDFADYPIEEALALPIFGSSEQFSKSRQQSSETHNLSHYKVVEKGDNFKPKKRWASWSPSRQDRFDWIAGDSMRSLGYDLAPIPNRSLLSRIRNACLDKIWGGIEMLFGAIQTLERALYAILTLRRNFRKLRMETGEGLN